MIMYKVQHTQKKNTQKIDAKSTTGKSQLCKQKAISISKLACLIQMVEKKTIIVTVILKVHF